MEGVCYVPELLEFVFHVLEVLDAVCCVLLCMLEAVEGLFAGGPGRDALCATLHA